MDVAKTHFDFSIYFESQSWWVALIDGKIAGFAGTQHKHDGTLFIGPCGVVPEYRGRGLQRQFLKAREQFARESGRYAAIVGATLATNWPSANNFIRRGFEINPGKAGHDLNYIHFLKWINKPGK
jgi:GNAT superfamily N-acetyltransferase